MLPRVSAPWATLLLLSACGGGTGPAEAPPAAQTHAGGADTPLPAHARGHPGHPGHGHGHGGAHHDFSDAEAFARLFDDPTRDAWQRPAEVVELLSLQAGMTVADLGAGTGYFLPHLSPAVGAEGRVLALDVEPNMVAHMERRASEAGLANVEARRVAPDDPGLPAGSVDRILVVDTWHHIGDRETYARRLLQALAPGGFVLVVDFTRESEHGPPPEMRLPPAVVEAELSAGGLAAEVVTESLPMQYVVRGRRP